MNVVIIFNNEGTILMVVHMDYEGQENIYRVDPDKEKRVILDRTDYDKMSTDDLTNFIKLFLPNKCQD